MYISLRKESCKLLVEKKIAERVLVIHHTTSGSCGVDELSDVKDEEGVFRKLRIQFKDRDCTNKILWVIYRVLRSFFVSAYFYFLPFFAVALTIIVPLHYVSSNNGQPPVQDASCA